MCGTDHLPLWYLPRWYRGSAPVSGGAGIWAVGGSLVLGRVTTASAGQYTCVANNTAGETRFSAHLLVTTPLSVQVSCLSLSFSLQVSHPSLSLSVKVTHLFLSAGESSLSLSL